MQSCTPKLFPFPPFPSLSLPPSLHPPLPLNPYPFPPPPIHQVVGRSLVLLLPVSRPVHSQALGSTTHVREGGREGGHWLCDQMTEYSVVSMPVFLHRPCLLLNHATLSPSPFQVHTGGRDDASGAFPGNYVRCTSHKVTHQSGHRLQCTAGKRHGGARRYVVDLDKGGVGEWTEIERRPFFGPEIFPRSYGGNL